MTGKSLFLYANFMDNIKPDDKDEYSTILRTENWMEFFKSKQTNEIMADHLADRECTKYSKDEQLQVAIVCLLSFIQSNFTGAEIEYHGYVIAINNKLNVEDIRKDLPVDGEDYNVNIKQSELLFYSKKVLGNLEKIYENDFELNWWNLRVTCIHQQIMEELCNSLYTKFKKYSQWLGENVSLLDNKELEVLLMIEISQGYILFRHVQECENWIDRACKCMSVNLTVEGLMGVRTKFQQKPLPQLCLRVDGTLEAELSAPDQTNKTELPMILKLDDEVRLERIQFSNPEDNDIMTHPSILQCLIFAKLKYIIRSQPNDRITQEQIEPYINALLYQTHGPFSIRLSTLLLNLKFEANSSRTIERSMKQCEEVIKLIKTAEKYETDERLSYYFTSLLPPIWQAQNQLGDLLLSLGLVKTALDLYLEIKSWENVILCYNRLELRHKAAEVIKQELDKKETPVLWCLLGDATDDVKCYEKAWNCSGKKSSRAQRHWGNYYYFKKNYEEAIPHLEKSLEINVLQESTLLRLGYAAIQMEKWELAAQTYVRYTHLEQRGFESWNNLAKALIKLGDKVRAHKILTEAIKCNHNNWKVWENFLIVSVDTSHFEDAINAYQRLMDLKDKYVDIEILDIIVKAIAKDAPDAQGRPSGRLRKKMNNLLGHLCVQNGNNPAMWELASLLAENDLSRTQKLQKAYRAYLQSNKSWVQSKELRIKVLTVCYEICISSLGIIEGVDSVTIMEKSTALSHLSSARLTTKATIKAIENLGEAYIEDWNDCLRAFQQLQPLMDMIEEQIEKYK